MGKKNRNMNEPDFFWKNFRLGSELQISGTFIYNALFFLDTIKDINNEEEIFELLYNLAVGIERLQKITLVLLEHDEDIDQQTYEKSLLTHNHLILHERINKIQKITLGKVHFKFLNIIRDFYTSYRYNRFNKMSVFKPDLDKQAFHEFLTAELQLKNSQRNEPWYPYKGQILIENSARIKKFIGKTVGKLISTYYEIIRNRALEVGTYTYEIRYGSKAFKIFIAKEFTFDIENNFKKEIIVNLVRGEGMNDNFKKYIQSLEPIKLDKYNSSYYIKYLLNSIANYSLINEYQYLIDEKQVPIARDEEIEPIGREIYLDFNVEESDN